MINRIKKAFTLTEVLIAVAIVGVIAALVLPIVITNYQERVMSYMARRQLQSIKSALESLAVTENKTRFGETTMGQGIDDDDHTGKFIKKYLRVSRYIGSPSTSSGISDAFASEYYKYEEKDGKHLRTKVTRAELDLKGSCAQLKNGISICITSQFGGTPVKVLMDVNGPKGPNIIGRDLIPWGWQDSEWSESIDLITDSSADRSGGAHPIIAENETPITPAQDPDCTSLFSDASTRCCKWKRDNNKINDKNDVCCSNSAISGTLAACAETVTINFNFYPTQGEYNSSNNKPYAKYSGTTVTPEIAIESIPAELGVKIKCGNGTYQGGVLSGSTIKSVMLAKSGNMYWPKKVNSSSCVFNQGKLYWSNNDSTSYTVSGVTYVLKQH